MASLLVLAACTAATPGQPSPEPSPTTAASTPTPVMATPTASPARTDSPTASPTDEPSPAATPTSPGEDPDDYGNGSGATPTTAAGPTTAPASPSGAALEVMTSDEHGDYLVVDGRAVYLFTPDTPNRSTCFDDCALTWPPVTGGVVAGEGVTGTLGGFSRPAGEGRQVTYNGDPLYFFAADTAEGDTNGEGRGGVWFLVEP